MKRTWTIIGVSDVAGSFKWYQSLFGQPETPPGHDYFGQILDTDGTVLLCLHQWGEHELSSPASKRSPTSTRTLKHGSSHSGIPTDTMSRSVRSLRPSRMRPNQPMQPRKSFARAA